MHQTRRIGEGNVFSRQKPIRVGFRIAEDRSPSDIPDKNRLTPIFRNVLRSRLNCPSRLGRVQLPTASR
jgi:hypothetical protein